MKFSSTPKKIVLQMPQYPISKLMGRYSVVPFFKYYLKLFFQDQQNAK